MVKQYEYEDGTSLNQDRIDEIGKEGWEEMSDDEKNDDLKQQYGFYKKGKADYEKGLETDTESSLDLDWGVLYTFNIYN